MTCKGQTLAQVTPEKSRSMDVAARSVRLRSSSQKDVFPLREPAQPLPRAKTADRAQAATASASDLIDKINNVLVGAAARRGQTQLRKHYGLAVYCNHLLDAFPHLGDGGANVVDETQTEGGSPNAVTWAASSFPPLHPLGHGDLCGGAEMSAPGVTRFPPTE